MPKVSIILPVYNAEKTILCTIKSICGQTFSDFELIVINDGSTDNTLQLLESLDDIRLKVFSYENQGLSTARNRGIIHASTQYIAFIDSDDLWTSDKLESQWEALKNSPEASVAYSWTLNMSSDEKLYHLGACSMFEGDVYSNLLISNFIESGSNVRN